MSVLPTQRVKKIFPYFYALLFAMLLLFAGLAYLKFQDNDYDSIIEKAAKLQRDNSEFIEFYGEGEPAFPDKKLNAETIAGIDANKNGIRDDIDIWINRYGLNKNETLAMRQYAKAKQEQLLRCDNQNSEKFFAASDCLSYLSDYQRKENGYAKKMLDFLIVNTAARKKCSAVESKNFKLESKNFHCDFEIEYIKNVIFWNKDWKK